MKLLVLVLACIALASAAPRTRSHKHISPKHLTPIHKTVPVRPNAPPPKQGGKIVGGEEADPHEFPHQVAVLINGNGFCGGSYIGGRWVLTAGHCVDGATRWEVTLGAHDLSDPTEESQTIAVSRAILHEAYNGAIIHNDIALLELESEPIAHENIVPVKLASRNVNEDPQEGDMVTASGWGKTCDGPLCGVSDTVNKVTTPVMSNAECKQTFLIVYDGNICIDTTGGMGTCNGDSGGPLHTEKDTDGNWTNYGITSFGASAGCAAGFPSAFTRVSYFRDWITTNSGI